MLPAGIMQYLPNKTSKQLRDMKTRSNQLKKPLFFLFLCIVMCCAETGRAVESMYGEVTANVNLRRSHGLHGKIITEIEKGQKVLIKDKIGDWYQVIVERKTYGYIGWIYGKYVEKIYTEKEKSAPPLDTRIIEATFKEAHSEIPLEIKEGNNPALLDKTQEGPYLLENIPAIKKVEKTQPIEREKSEITPESVSPENLLSNKEEKKQNCYKALQLTIKVPTMKAIASSLIAFLHSMTRIRIPLMNNTTSSRVS